VAAVFKPDEPPLPREAQLEPMTHAWLPAVARIEQSAYEHPWTQGNFSDSIRAGYHAQLLTGAAVPTAELIGYFVAMKGVDEVHLLNITVAPPHQRQGWARLMLDALTIWSRGEGAQWLWLEVRVSNRRAQAIYEQYGFRQVGLRRGYYPATATRREDAQVMSLAL
jgi:[ribosomal protein S18]-alanine N-acetyltransferase